MSQIKDSFFDKLREILIFHQEDYKKKKKLKGEKVDCFKMHKAINQRKEIKQVNKLMKIILSNKIQELREGLRVHEALNNVFIIGEKQ